MSKRVAWCLTAAVLLSGSAALAAHHEEAAYEKLIEDWATAYNDGDAAAVARLYVEDGIRMPPDLPLVEGREAIEAQVQDGIDQGLAEAEIEAVEVTVMGETAAARGTWRGMDAEGNQIAAGKWANLCKWVDGGWQIVYDIWNLDAPMATPE